MRILPLLSIAFLSALSIPLAALAQTYTPRQIVIQGAAGMDKEDILKIADLKEGVPLTKEQIEAALERLGASGSFADLGYTVNTDALTLQLTLSASAQMMPVTYSNFVWFKPEELTPLIQARVPLYQGKLPLQGNLTDQVEAALVAILKEKSIDATVTTVQAMHGSGISLVIATPAIYLGNITVNGTVNDVANVLKQMQAGFAGQEFDLQRHAKAVAVNVTDLYNNAGYLDATTDPTTFARLAKAAPAITLTPQRPCIPARRTASVS